MKIKDSRIVLRLRNDFKKEVTAYAESEDLSVSNLIRRVLKKEISK